MFSIERWLLFSVEVSCLCFAHTRTRQLYVCFLSVSRMQYMDKVGLVHRITDKGDVRVQFDGCGNRWTFFAGALSKVLLTPCFRLINKTYDVTLFFVVSCSKLDAFSVGDFVQLCSDPSKVKELQQKEGERVKQVKSSHPPSIVPTD